MRDREVQGAFILVAILVTLGQDERVLGLGIARQTQAPAAEDLLPGQRAPGVDPAQGCAQPGDRAQLSSGRQGLLGDWQHAGDGD
jgi:hypothetical protein